MAEALAGLSRASRSLTTGAPLEPILLEVVEAAALGAGAEPRRDLASRAGRNARGPGGVGGLGCARGRGRGPACCFHRGRSAARTHARRRRRVRPHSPAGGERLDGLARARPPRRAFRARRRARRVARSRPRRRSLCSCARTDAPRGAKASTRSTSPATRSPPWPTPKGPQAASRAWPRSRPGPTPRSCGESAQMRSRSRAGTARSTRTRRLERAASAILDEHRAVAVQGDRRTGEIVTLQLGQPPLGALQLRFPPGRSPDELGLPQLASFAVRAAHALRTSERAREAGFELERSRALLAVVGEAIARLSLSHTLDTAIERVADLLGSDRARRLSPGGRPGRASRRAAASTDHTRRWRRRSST